MVPRRRPASLALVLLTLLLIASSSIQALVIPPPRSLSRPAAAAAAASLCSSHAPPPLQSASLPNPFGFGGKDRTSASPSSSAAAGAVVPGIRIQELTAGELRLAARVCIYAFFDREPGTLTNPIKSMQLGSLEDEQLRDLRGRFGGRQLGRSVMLKAVDDAAGGAIVGFVELRVRSDLKYGLGPDVAPRDERPYLANLAVLPSARRRGIGRALVEAGEALVRDAWGYEELILQVEDTNAGARRMYEQLGYEERYVDPAGKKYALEGMKIKSVRCRKVGMRKQLLRGGGGEGGGDGPFGGFLGLFK